MPANDKILKHAIIVALPQVFHLAFKVLMVNVLPGDYSRLEAFIAALAIVATPLSALTAWASYRTSRLVVAGDAAAVGRFTLSSVRTFAFVGLGAGLASLALGLIFRGSPAPGNPVLSEIFAACVVFVVLSPVLNGLLQGRQRYGSLALYILAFAVAKVTLGGVFAAAGLGVNGGALAILGAYVISVTAAVLLLSAPVRGVSGPFSPSAVRLPAPRSAQVGYLGLSAVALSAMSILFFSDVVILRNMMHTDGVDSFAAAKIVGNIFIYAPIPIIASMFPKVTERHYSGETTFFLLWKGLGLSAAICALGLVAWWFLAPTLGDWGLGGRHYENVGVMSRVYCLAIAPYALANVLVQFSVARGRWRFLAVIIPGAVVHVVLVFLFAANLWSLITAVGIFGCVVFTLVLLVVLSDRKFARG